MKQAGYQKTAPTEYRISLGMIFLLICASLAFDLINVIPIVGTIISWIYWILLSVYLYITGHGLLNVRRLAPTFVSLAIEFWPALQVLPSIFAATVAIIILSRLEDRIGLQVLGHAGPKTRLPRKPAPLNQNGVRPPRKEGPVIDVDSSTVEE